MLTAPQSAALAAELKADPLALGYADAIRAGNDQAVADLLNDRAGKGAAPVALASVTRAQFLAGILPAILALAGKDDATQRKWDRIIGAAAAVDSVIVADPNIAAVYQMAIGDGLLSADQVAAATNRLGSRAEVLFGADAAVTTSDVSFALRGAR